MRNDMPNGAVRLHPRAPPPANYYADNLLAVVDTVLLRYRDVLTGEERAFGEGIKRLSPPALRLLARLAGRAGGRAGAPGTGGLLREDALRYAEVPATDAALAELAAAGLVERDSPAPVAAILAMFTTGELARVFWDVPVAATARKADRVARIAAASPAGFVRWRARRHCRWARLAASHLPVYQLLFFGDRRKDLTTFVLRDLGVHRYEPVSLGADTRQFRDRAMLERYLALLAAADELSALGALPAPRAVREQVPRLLEELWNPLPERLLERRRSRVLNRLARNLERTGAFDEALACYTRSTLPPARERRMRILRRLGDDEGVETLRGNILASPADAVEADFAARFARTVRRAPVPILEQRLGSSPDSIENHALAMLTRAGGVGWHLENNLPMAVFALAYWHWLFAPIEGAFVNPFQTGPVDLFWPDFFRVRQHVCEDPLATPLKPRLAATARAKAGVANRLFNWRRFTPAVADAVFDAMPEAHLRALVDIVRGDLAGKSAGFPDLTVIRGPGNYEFVEVKGPNDQLQVSQRLWIAALLERGLPVRVLRFRQ